MTPTGSGLARQQGAWANVLARGFHEFVLRKIF